MKKNTLMKKIRNFVIAAAVIGTTCFTGIPQMNGAPAIATVEAAPCSSVKLANPTTKVENVTTGVRISWKRVSKAKGYIIYRKQGNGAFKQIATIKSSAAVNYVDKRVSSNGNYTYAVRAFNGSYKSSYTSKTIRYLAAPKCSTAKRTKSGISLRWNAVAGAKGYMVYRKTGNGTYKRVGFTTSLKATAFVDKTAKKGTTYTYTVKAFNASAFSSFISKTIR